MALVIVILVLLLTLAFFYLKCSVMQSVMMLWSAILTTIITFSYYEWVAEFLISRGYALQWAQFACFLAVFIVAFAVLRLVSDLLIGVDIDLGNTVKLSTALPCGLLTGVIVSGNLLVALGLFPMQGKLFYSRFDPSEAVVVSQPKIPMLSTDGFVSNLYGLISSGSMNSGKSFNVLHADYLSQNHLNKLKTKEQVLAVSSRKALILPRGKDQKPIRWETLDDKEVIIVRAGIVAKDIEKGGTGKPVNFFPAQIRLIFKEADSKDSPLVGAAKVKYPDGFWKNGVLEKSDLNGIITPDSTEIRDKVYWMDVAFQCPKNKKPILLEFKQNAVVDLTLYEVVKNTPEIEQALDN